MDDDERPVDAAGILATIETDRERTQAALAPDARVLCGTWGAAWILGFAAVFLACWPSERPTIPLAVGLAVAAAALVGAILVSALHAARRGSATRGPSTVQGAIFGNAFPVAFLLVGALGFRLATSGVAPETMLAYWVVAPCLVIGGLGVAGAAMWNDRSQLVFSVWVLLVGFVAAWIPGPYVLLVGVGGGLGFLVLAIVASVRPRLVSGPIASRHG